MNSQGVANIALYDMLGRQIKQVYQGTLSAGDQSIQLNAESLEEGLYFVTININNQSITKKIVVGQ
jgi:hypothetical protein